jgi:hypothetical protein
MTGKSQMWTDPMHQFPQFLDRIQVSKITPEMIISLLSFTQDPPTYDNLRSYIPAVYASIPYARLLKVTNMVLIHANQLFSDWQSYPKCLTFEYAEDAKYTLLVFSQLYDQVIAGKLHMASVMPVAPSTNINSRAVGFHMAANGALIEKSSSKYGEEFLPVCRALHGNKVKIAAYMAGEVDPQITSKADAKDSERKPDASEAGQLTDHAGRIACKDSHDDFLYGD